MRVRARKRGWGWLRVEVELVDGIENMRTNKCPEGGEENDNTVWDAGAKQENRGPREAWE